MALVHILAVGTASSARLSGRQQGPHFHTSPGRRESTAKLIATTSAAGTGRQHRNCTQKTSTERAKTNQSSGVKLIGVFAQGFRFADGAFIDTPLYSSGASGSSRDDLLQVGRSSAEPKSEIAAVRLSPTLSACPSSPGTPCPSFSCTGDGNSVITCVFTDGRQISSYVVCILPCWVSHD